MNRSSEQGIYLIIMAVAAFVLVVLCALAIGLGFVSFNRTIHQDTANLASLGAIEEYVRVQGTYQEKTDLALARANYLLSQNRLKNVAGDLGDLGHAPNGGDGGTLFFGTWYETDPSFPPPTPAPCASYPCFVENPEPGSAPSSTTANAVRMQTRNQTGAAANPIFLPFGSVLGKEFATIESESIAIMIPRCLALLVDVSGSITGNTHSTNGLQAVQNPTCVDPEPEFVTNPPLASFFAYRQSSLTANCCSLNSSLEKMLWCNQNINGLLVRDPHSPVNPIEHFRSDYALHPSPVGDVQIDTLYDEASGYFGPEPYSTVFKAFNAVTRLLTQQASVGDRAMLLAFTGNVVDRIPPGTGMTKEFGLLAQLTNLMNIGLKNKSGVSVSSRVLPNMIYRGWFPVYGVSNEANGTNLPLAIYSAINELADPANCPATAKKAIILASDGIATCNASPPTYTPDCTVPLWDRYQDARAELLDDILPELQERQISFSYMLAGGASGANFMNRANPDWPVPPNDPDDPRRFLTPEQAIARGFGGALSPQNERFFDQGSYQGETSVSEEDAYNNAGNPDWIFGDPNGVLGELAFSTGGVPCPLMPVGNVNDYYDHDSDQGGSPCTAQLCENCTPCVLKSSKRVADSAQRSAIEWRTQAEIAAACAVKAIGEDPYALREVPLAGSN